MSKFVATIFGIALSVSAIPSAFAQTSQSSNDIRPTKWYQVELYIFDRRTGPVDSSASAEKWQQDVPLIPTEQATKLINLQQLKQQRTTKLEQQNQQLPNSFSDQSAVSAPAQTLELQTAAETVSADLDLPDPATVPWVELEKENFEIKEVKQFKTLTHLAWRQPAQTKQQANWIRINAVELETPVSALIETAQNPFDLPQNDSFEQSKLFAVPERQTSLQQTDSTNYMLDGRVRLSLNSYLHFDSELVIQQWLKKEQQPVIVETISQLPSELAGIELPNTVGQPVIGNDNNELTLEEVVGSQQPQMVDYLQNYPLLQHRRIKKNRLQYFDHPLFGVLVIIRDYKLPEPKPEPEIIAPAAAEVENDGNPVIKAPVTIEQLSEKPATATE
ncbi:CsiV family protein [Pelagibaculum spongiae]|uniref:Peptidoglycan-binding protein CsiV n=1 Tax=Pelagibaculum spongiae TaxID=2080658 RepID=A0A2V1GZW9_9GAMM|nr:CsiV family protein [Pelagibaculum spongiae]PVZ68881.1 hypothetical protein DC094_11550 [Pelagibaculum spongiae]